MEMALGGRSGDLALGGAEILHVLARERGIDVHEDTVFAGVFERFGGQFEPFAECQQVPLGLFLGVDIPAAAKRLEHQVAFLGVEHFLAARDQRHPAHPGLEIGIGLIEACGGRTTGVLHIHDGDRLEAHGTQGTLAAHRVLAFHHALAGVGEPRGLDIAHGCARIGECGGDSLAGEFLDRFVRKLAQSGHANANDVDIRHVPDPCWKSLTVP